MAPTLVGWLVEMQPGHIPLHYIAVPAALRATTQVGGLGFILFICFPSFSLQGMQVWYTHIRVRNASLTALMTFIYVYNTPATATTTFPTTRLTGCPLMRAPPPSPPPLLPLLLPPHRNTTTALQPPLPLLLLPPPTYEGRRCLRRHRPCYCPCQRGRPLQQGAGNSTSSTRPSPMSRISTSSNGRLGTQQ